MAITCAVLEEILRTRRLWPTLAEALSKADAGNARMMLELIDSTPGNNATDDFQTAVLAVDQQYGHRPAHEYFELIKRSERRYPHFWFLSGHWDLVRAVWPVNDHDAFRGRVRNPATAAPILVIGITHDPATPYVQAQRLTDDLGVPLSAHHLSCCECRKRHPTALGLGMFGSSSSPAGRIRSALGRVAGATVEFKAGV